MKKGYLSQYFKGVVAKRLSAVEANAVVSNQHEFNGIVQMQKLFGTAKCTFKAKFIYLCDDTDIPVVSNGFLTWYDARERHPTRSEYRMYFSTTEVSKLARAEDTLCIGLCPDDSTLIVIAAANSTIGNQLSWLFGVDDTHSKFSVKTALDSEKYRIVFTSRFILEQLGIDVETDDSFLEEMLLLFDGTFPKTKVFSAYARSTLKNVNALDNPDTVLMAWIEREEELFRSLEKHLVSERLAEGFNSDVDEFMRVSLSVQNRRKCRVGQALENHVEQLLIARKIHYDRVQVTENKAKPDFIFPGIQEYHDPAFYATALTMLGVKNTCKDRWRQVLAEAEKITNKHLLTLEAAISENQTQEMINHQLQLVIPASLHETYSVAQRSWLMDVSSFFNLVQDKQARYTRY